MMDINPIHSKADHKAALKLVSKLVDLDPARSTPEGDMLEVMSTLIAAYEARHFPMEAADIDGAQGGNATRHVNHACMPNVAAVEHYADNDKLELVVSAIRRIRFGELVRCSPASVGQKAASV